MLTGSGPVSSLSWCAEVYTHPSTLEIGVIMPYIGALVTGTREVPCPMLTRPSPVGLRGRWTNFVSPAPWRPWRGHNVSWWHGTVFRQSGATGPGPPLDVRVRGRSHLAGVRPGRHDDRSRVASGFWMRSALGRDSRSCCGDAEDRALYQFTRSSPIRRDAEVFDGPANTLRRASSSRRILGPSSRWCRKSTTRPAWNCWNVSLSSGSRAARCEAWRRFPLTPPKPQG